MAIFETLCDYVSKSIELLNKPIDLDENKQPVMTLKEKQVINEKQVKAIGFTLKATEEILSRFSSNASGDEFSEFLTINISKIVKMVSLSCEQNDIIIQNQAQLLFQFLMG